MCVLLVEDEALIRLMVAEELAQQGFDCQEAGSGDEAVRLMDEVPQLYSLLVTDIQMPGSRDGMELARHFRERHPGVPVIFISGRTDLLERAEKGPRDTHLLKPFEPAELLAQVHRLTLQPLD